MIDLKNAVNGKEIPKNQNPKKAIDIAEKIFKLNKQQKGKWFSLDLSLKIISSKQMLQRLPETLAQLQAVSTSENLLNKIHQIIIIFFISSKRNYEKIIYNVTNSIKVMNTILMNSENSKMSEPHSLLLNVADKILNNFDHFQSNFYLQKTR